MSILQNLIAAIGSSSWVFALLLAADVIVRTLHRSKYSISDIATPSFFSTEIFRRALVAGCLLFVGQVVFVGLFYYAYQKYGAYVPMKIPGEHSTYFRFEFLTYFFESLSTSIYEETLYRAFLICLFILAFRRAWMAVVISSVLWGFLHFSYQFDPYYVRGLELTLIGLAYGFVMLRFGVLSIFTAHFLYNSFVSSEYEFQHAAYLATLLISIVGLYGFSWLLRNKASMFEFHRLRLPVRTESTTTVERRKLNRNVQKFNWRYGVALLFLIGLILSRMPLPQRDTNPLTNRTKLIEASSGIMDIHESPNAWNITYNLYDVDTNSLRSQAIHLVDHADSLKEINTYAYLWAIRYYDRASSKILCDFTYANNYELMQLKCPFSNQTMHMNVGQWIERIKAPNETWELSDSKSTGDNIMEYSYVIDRKSSASIQWKARLIIEDGHLAYFKKQMSMATATQVKDKTNRFENTALAAIGIVALLVLIGFLKLLFQVVKVNGFYNQIAARISVISSLVFFLWKVNAFKLVLIGFNGTIDWRYIISNEVIYSFVKVLAIAFTSYIIGYAFVHLPSQVFSQVPSSSNWIQIFKRPVWKWRNTKISLLSATVLVAIQFLLRVLVQIDNGLPELDLYRFDVGYLNHEYVFITFLGLFWKNILFWMSLMVLISVFEKYVSKRIYIALFFIAIFTSIWLAQSDLDAKLIEMCGMYIIFYFIYKIARFDFAFYFWFVLFNTMMTFVPLIEYPQYQQYFYQVVVILIFVAMLVIYTLFGPKKIVIVENQIV